MPLRELDAEIGSGVAFWGHEAQGALVGVMGIQPVGDVELIRHAYVLPSMQGLGVGTRLLAHLRRQTTQRMLVGTWAAAHWAIRFYRSHGFELVSPDPTTALLRRYWTIPERQIETSVVLATLDSTMPERDSLALGPHGQRERRRARSPSRRWITAGSLVKSRCETPGLSVSRKR